MSITFNIIYTIGTVDRLLPFVHTLLKYTDTCCFRLVDNGCSVEEAQRLKNYCQRSDRLEFYSLGVRKIVSHGQALNHLFGLDSSELFAFMDSDIFATGPFLEPHLQALEEHAGICSCLPIWHRPSEIEMREDFAIMGGCFLRTHSQTFLGVSYYAIYRRSAVQSVMDSTGIDFERYTWNQLTPQQQQSLAGLGLKKNLYDTAKVLNIFLQQHGFTLSYEESAHLLHIGAFSGLSLQTQSLHAILRNSLINNMPTALRRYLRRLRDPAYKVLSNEELAETDFRALRRRATTNYLYYLLASNPRTPPERYLSRLPSDLQTDIKALGEQFLALHRAV